MGQGSHLHLEDVISHLPGRDASLSRADASSGIPVQAEAYRCGDDLAVTITQSERAQCIKSSHNETIVFSSRRFGNEDGSAPGKVCGDSTTLKHTFVCIEQETGP